MPGFIILGLTGVMLMLVAAYLLDRVRKSGPTLAQRAGGGWVLQRRLATEHECHPPGVCADRHNIQNGGTSWNLWEGNAQWSNGDLWLCECGKAWAVADVERIIPRWVRTPSEDL